MTPKEKALDLKVKMFERIPDCVENDYAIYIAKGCAIIAVNELIDCTPSVDGRPPNYQDINKSCYEYWQQVKIELEKL